MTLFVPTRSSSSEPPACAPGPAGKGCWGQTPGVRDVVSGRSREHGHFGLFLGEELGRLPDTDEAMFPRGAELVGGTVVGNVDGRTGSSSS